ncbi:LamG-like jellyroll fold domain-containing protein [Modestobacter sp. NPDC049651]|uniref:LamG-like jellyroll fold domain-containing protein n=1 Tax=unclassified Modestobacter TaxID=2643866 RepID=UPI003400C517
MSTSPWRQSWAAFLVSTTARAALGVLALLVLASTVPALLGWQATVVMSGSMEPSISPGDVTVVRPVDSADLHRGQVLLVDDPDSPGRLRLHRLVAVEDGGLQLRGDANAAADTALVDPSAVHGVGTLRLPGLGLPVLWAQQGRALPVAGTAVALAGLVAAALLYRRSPSAPSGPSSSGPSGSSGRRWRLRGGSRRRWVGAGAALLLLAAVPGAAQATFTASTSAAANTFSAFRYFTCAGAASTADAYFPMQETSGSTAANSGPYPWVVGTYSSVRLGQVGPNCGNGVNKAVAFDGSSSLLYTTTSLTDPESFTIQLWFSTKTRTGGKLCGFGNGTYGSASTQFDRHVYMTDTGKLVFGVYPGQPATVTSPKSYNDGAWHLMTATFSPGTGMRLYVDGGQVAADPSVTQAEQYTGYWRVGYDTIGPTWPSAPTSEHFAGSIAHASLAQYVLTPAQIADQYVALN